MEKANIDDGDGQKSKLFIEIGPILDKMKADLNLKASDLDRLEHLLNFMSMFAQNSVYEEAHGIHAKCVKQFKELGSILSVIKNCEEMSRVIENDLKCDTNYVMSSTNSFPIIDIDTVLKRINNEINLKLATINFLQNKKKLGDTSFVSLKFIFSDLMKNLTSILERLNELETLVNNCEELAERFEDIEAYIEHLQFLKRSFADHGEYYEKDDEDEPLDERVGLKINDMKKEIGWVEETNFDTDDEYHPGKGKSNNQSMSKKRYRCTWDGCDAVTYTLRNMRQHQLTHSSLKPHPCPWDGCNMRFSHSGNLNQHYRLHSGERPYYCDFVDCGRRFRQSTHLKRHSKVHIGELQSYGPLIKMESSSKRKSSPTLPVKLEVGEHSAADVSYECDAKKSTADNNCAEFHCDHKACPEIFSDRKQLFQHKFVYHGFSCDKAGRNINHKSSEKISKGQIRRSEKRAYICEHTGCNRVFLNPITFSQHVSDHGTI